MPRWLLALLAALLRPGLPDAQYWRLQAVVERLEALAQED